MNRSVLEIRITNTEGALERILGKLRSRSFAICSIMAERTENGAAIEARITVESVRPSDLAAKQIGKLYDVEYVHVRAMEAEESNGYREQLQTAVQV